MSPRELQTALLGMLGTLAVFARFTPSQKDDRVLQLLTMVVLDPALFGELLVVLGKAGDGNSRDTVKLS